MGKVKKIMATSQHQAGISVCSFFRIFSSWVHETNEMKPTISYGLYPWDPENWGCQKRSHALRTLSRVKTGSKLGQFARSIRQSQPRQSFALNSGRFLLSDLRRVLFHTTSASFEDLQWIGIMSVNLLKWQTNHDFCSVNLLHLATPFKHVISSKYIQIPRQRGTEFHSTWLKPC